MAGANITPRSAESETIPRITRSNHGNLIDLSLRKFGRWFVTSQAKDAKQPSGQLRTMWNCVCECGYKASVDSDALIRGRSLSCGCLKSDLMRMRRQPAVQKPAKKWTRRVADLTGEPFGRWRVEHRVSDQIDRAGQRRQTWACVCECGTRKDVRGSDLRQGKSRSCGCLRKEVLPEARRLARLRRQVAAVDAAF